MSENTATLDIESVFSAELTRLLALNLSSEEEQIARRYYSDKERQSMDADSFCGPSRSFPITSQEDVTNAARLIGHADNPDAVKRCVIGKAKAHGWDIPDAWKSDDDKERIDTPVVLRADGNHDPMSGVHTHQHSAFSSQGQDATHEHEHSHDNDADHDHSHAEDRATMPTTAALYAPITRIDKSKWEVEGVATSEEIDSFGTIFSYEASKKAFQRWMERTANVREMHDKKAVGKGITVRFDDDARKIYLRTRVSRGASDTWLKIEDGVLDGYSVGATNPVWGTTERNGKQYPYLISYDLAETSLVDNASNPDGQGLTLCRADGLTEIVDTSEPEPPPPDTPQTLVGSDLSVLSSTDGTADVTRAGARISGATQSKMHEGIAHSLHAALSGMQNCGCATCVAAAAMIDPDNDGDIDMGGYDDPDNDAASLYGESDAPDGDDEARMAALMERIMEPITARLATALSAMTQRSNMVLARFAGQPEYPDITPDLIRSALSAELSTQHAALTEQITALSAALERVERTSSLPEVRAELSAVKEVVERIAAQPAPGGPILNGGVYPVEKRLAHQQSTAPNQMSARAFWDEAQRQGLLSTPDLQMRAAQESIVPLAPRR